MIQLLIENAITINTTVNHDLKTLKKLLEPISDIRLEVVQRSGVIPCIAPGGAELIRDLL